MNRFFIGQKVVCVDDSPRNYPTSSLYKGKIYTVRGITHGGHGLALLEVISPYNSEGAYWDDRFAPLSERTAESEAFAETLITELETKINESNLVEK